MAKAVENQFGKEMIESLLADEEDCVLFKPSHGLLEWQIVEVKRKINELKRWLRAHVQKVD